MQFWIPNKDRNIFSEFFFSFFALKIGLNPYVHLSLHKFFKHGFESSFLTTFQWSLCKKLEVF